MRFSSLASNLWVHVSDFHDRYASFQTELRRASMRSATSDLKAGRIPNTRVWHKHWWQHWKCAPGSLKGVFFRKRWWTSVGALIKPTADSCLQLTRSNNDLNRAFEQRESWLRSSLQESPGMFFYVFLFSAPISLGQGICHTWRHDAQEPRQTFAPKSCQILNAVHNWWMQTQGIQQMCMHAKWIAVRRTCLKVLRDSAWQMSDWRFKDVMFFAIQIIRSIS